MNLTTRHKTILRLVVEEYVATGAPVSSARVTSRQKGRKLSPATVRACMASLTEIGLLQQPHTNAGRIPTECGLRHYVDGSLSPRLHPWDRTHLDAAVQGPATGALPARLGHSLAVISGQVAVVGVPRFAGSTFREIGLARYGVGRFVVFFVSPGEQVQQKMVEVDFDLSSDELQRIQNFLNERLTHRTLSEVRASIRVELANHEAQRDRLRRSALEIGLKALPDPEMELSIDGTAQLASQPEFADVGKLRSVLAAIEEKQVLLQLLDRVLEETGITVVLGSEHHVSRVRDLACVGGGCDAPSGERSAAITLMGPARMDYDRLVPLVRYATMLLGRHWGQY